MYKIMPITKSIEVHSLVCAVDAVRPKNFYFSGEMHDFWEVVLVYSGTATATADERIYNLQSGDLLFHKPMEFHRIWSGSDNAPHLKIISFCASGEGMKYFENSFFRLDPHETQAFAHITEGFVQNTHCDKPPDYNPTQKFSPSLTAALLEVFLLELLEKEKFSRNTFSHNEEQYYNIVRVMKENCNKSMSLAQLAELCNMSQSNLKRIFGCYSDIGPAKYFTTLKMRHAAELLNSGMSAAETAAALGFNEICYFYTVFKREYGMTPAQYTDRKKRI